MEKLQARKVWVNWQKDAERGKIPVNPCTMGNAMSNNPSTWSTYPNAYDNMIGGHCTGVGFMFSDGLCGVDIDGHDGHNALGAEILDLFKDTYCELSPSGNGYHILFYCDMSQIPQEQRNETSYKLRSDYYQKNPHNGIECYMSGLTNRFFTYTGNRVSAGNDIIDQTEQVLYLLNKYMKKGAAGMNAQERIEETDTIRLARSAKNGSKFIALYDNGDKSDYNNDDSSADLALCSMLAFWLGGNENSIDTAFRASALYRPKWERTDYRTVTIKKGIEACRGEYYSPKAHRGNVVAMKPTRAAEVQQEDNKQHRERFTIESLENELAERAITVRHNIITNSTEIFGYNATESAEHILSVLPTLLYSELNGKYKGVSMDTIQNYLQVISTRNRYNPVLDKFNATKWNGKDNLSEVYEALNIAEDDKLSRVLILKWFWQGYSLLHNTSANPFGADGVLTLMGAQGIGKTSFFRKCAIDTKWFRGGQCINAYDKDTKRRVVTTWIAELGEVETTLKSDMEALKAFITDDYDEYRLPYGRIDQRNARHTNLCATCNSTRFLIDASGNRRFWTIPLTDINLDLIDEIDFSQVWAQVIEQYAREDLQGFRLTRQEREELENRNGTHEKLLKSEAEVLDILSKAEDDKTSYDFVLMTVSEFKAQNEVLRGYSVEQIGKALSKHKIEAQRKKQDGVAMTMRYLPKFRYNGSY